MKAIVYTQYGAPDVLQLKDVDMPTPKDDELLIKVYATTVTTGDSNIRNFTFVPRGFELLTRLAFGFTKPRKQILGIEFAGVVVKVGKNVTQFAPNDEVYGIDSKNLAAYAEYKCVPASGAVVIKPKNMTFTQAAAIPNGALTALTFLRDMAKLQAGQQILIIGASGSVGSFAVQIAHQFGAEVTAVCSGANAAWVQALGAQHVIDYTQEDFMHSGKTYDFVLDVVGKSAYPACKPVLKPNGLYLAVAGGMREALQMAVGKPVKMGPSSEQASTLQFVNEWVASGKLTPKIDRCYPLAEAAEAHRYVDTGRKRGNVVLNVVDTLA